MLDFIKKFEKRHYILFATVAASVLIKQIPNRSLVFLFETINNSIIIPIFIWAFWDSFALLFTIKNKKPNKPRLTKNQKITIAIVIYTIIFNGSTIARVTDIPNAIRSDYEVAQGEVTNQIIKGSRRKTQYFEIDSKIYGAPANDFDVVEKHKIYRVTFLKNSGYIMDIEKID